MRAVGGRRRGSLPGVTPAPDAPERHRAPALWLVVAGLAAATVTAAVRDAGQGAALLALTLACAAIARLVGRGRRPEGIAVRSTWLDVVVLLGLAAGVAVLSLSPGV
ncbi:MAG: hypothetical protein JWP95_8 [Actinotalea sp.]|nr:hypothetical protein [Actinotalea sp.]